VKNGYLIMLEACRKQVVQIAIMLCLCGITCLSVQTIWQTIKTWAKFWSWNNHILCCREQYKTQKICQIINI